MILVSTVVTKTTMMEDPTAQLAYAASRGTFLEILVVPFDKERVRSEFFQKVEKRAVRLRLK